MKEDKPRKPRKKKPGSHSAFRQQLASLREKKATLKESTTATTRKDFGFTTSLRLAPAEAEDFVLPFRPFMMSPLRNLRGHIPFRG